MNELPTELKYATSHEWIRRDGDIVTVGITDFAQSALGDVVYVELPDIGVELAASDEVGVIESVKAASDIYSPVSGVVVAVNEDLEDSPENINSDAYGDGWFLKIQLKDDAELDSLLTAEEYLQHVEPEDAESDV